MLTITGIRIQVHHGILVAHSHCPNYAGSHISRFCHMAKNMYIFFIIFFIISSFLTTGPRETIIKELSWTGYNSPSFIAKIFYCRVTNSPTSACQKNWLHLRLIFIVILNYFIRFVKHPPFWEEIWFKGKRLSPETKRSPSPTLFYERIKSKKLNTITSIERAAIFSYR